MNAWGMNSGIGEKSVAEKKGYRIGKKWGLDIESGI